jgi:hypothetical protein
MQVKVDSIISIQAELPEEEISWEIRQLQKILNKYTYPWS